MIETLHHAPIVYRIYEELKRHIGEENSISARDLSDIFNISKRKLREYINTICESTELEKVIGSGNKGYYVCREEDYAKAENRIKSTTFSLMMRWRAMERKAGKDGQMKLQLGKFYSDTFEAFGE